MHPFYNQVQPHFAWSIEGHKDVEAVRCIGRQEKMWFRLWNYCFAWRWGRVCGGRVEEALRVTYDPLPELWIHNAWCCESEGREGKTVSLLASLKRNLSSREFSAQVFSRQYFCREFIPTLGHMKDCCILGNISWIDAKQTMDPDVAVIALWCWLKKI